MSCHLRAMSVRAAFKQKHDELTEEAKEELKLIEEQTLKLELIKIQYGETRSALLELEHAHSNLADEKKRDMKTISDCIQCRDGTCNNYWHPEPENDGRY
ncbi:unnamed protein product [Oikopleura dioica]|uniref:Uncharacterized protein n=1 Tax=Oikopleura dioica TaxID=34765 RepID=E4Y1R7_OIKDI|nr:unnamed protein product [Oikopleura dioica]